MCTQSKDSKPIKVFKGIDETIVEEPAYAKYGNTKLSEYGFFVGELKDLTPANNVLPYELNSALFSDYALKKRFISYPEGITMAFTTGSALSFPIGTTIIKNFYYSDEQTKTASNKIIETRLLIHNEKGWEALSYIWNKDQTEAYLELTGGDLEVNLADKGQFIYSIPTVAQCKSCHDKSGKLMPIGPSVRQLNRDYPYPDGDMNQLDKLMSLGWLSRDADKELWPKMVDYLSSDHPISDRARSYMDVNCAHCHNDQGPAKNSGLSLTYYEQDPYKLGINKKPVAAGRGSGDMKFNIVPGFPDQSILLHRMMISDPGTRMPELGRSLMHVEGVEIIRRWISEIEI